MASAKRRRACTTSPGSCCRPARNITIGDTQPTIAHYRTIAQIAQQSLWDSEARDALYFHATYVHPTWARQKTQLAQIDTLNPQGGVWTFWDFQAGAWQRDQGFRIDHLLLSPQAADQLVAAGVDKEYRGREKASDHAPVWVDLA